MDNKGGFGGGLTGAGEGFKAPENISPMGEVPGFDEFLKGREDLKPAGEQPISMETPNQTAEVGAEMMSSAMPATMPPGMAPMDDNNTTTQATETPALTELKSINVPRDAERLPKEYVAAITKIINTNKRDPHKLVDDLDEARWDMLSKAYGRNFGDGLNGSNK
ncbi:MAG: hypothetical protein MJ154_03685 [Candidatus Saccharibacteria bacterium]|nr:hypothetical protein [Candidatus Saccharibacteria bacterium]